MLTHPRVQMLLLAQMPGMPLSLPLEPTTPGSVSAPAGKDSSMFLLRMLKS